MEFIANSNLSFETASLTDIGKIRENNEDSLFALNKEEPNSLGADSFGIYLVADGMGGHQAGEVASEMASRIISSTLLNNLEQTNLLNSPRDLVEMAIQKANHEICRKARSKPELRTMGTTLTLGFRLDNRLYIGHVGDSRAYLIRNGKIEQLTEDHSVVGLLLKEGMITDMQAKTHSARGKILRFLGVSGAVSSDVIGVILHPEDCLVLCSDGLTDNISDDEILNCVSNCEIAEDVCSGLVDLTNSRGGGDNSSVIVVRVIAESSK